MKKNGLNRIGQAACAAVIGCVSTLAVAEPPPPPPGGAMSPPAQGDKAARGTKHGKMMHKGLDLSKAQKKQMREMKMALKPKMKTLMDELGKVREELRSFSTSDHYNEAKARELANKQGQLVADLFFMQSKMQHQFYEMLTPEQKNTLKNMTATVRGGRRGAPMPQPAKP